jgi:hypothetical protein
MQPYWTEVGPSLSRSREQSAATLTIVYWMLVWDRGEIPMPQILIRCPKFGRAIATGLQTEKIKFDSLAGIQFSVVCPACGKIHRWRQHDAWIVGTENDQLPDGRSS